MVEAGSVGRVLETWRQLLEGSASLTGADALVATAPAPVAVIDPLTAEQVIDRARDAQRVDSSIQKVRMVLISRTGSERVRELELRVVKDGGVIKSYARFSHPSDVAGTQLVVVDNPGTADEQILYLPALQRVNRIAGKARSGSFLGSDFFYEDLEVSDQAGAAHRIVSQDDQGWVIESVPGDDSSYGRILVHVPRSDYLPRKVEFFDKKDQPFKVLEVQEVGREGNVVFPIRSVMTNLHKGTSTRLEVLEHRLNVPREEIPDETFTGAWMERHR